MVRRLIIPGAVLVVVLVLLVGGVAASSDGDGDANGDAAPLVSPPEVRTAVFERSYSECSTVPVVELAAKYRTIQTRDDVSTAVGRAWAETFGGAADAARLGKRACLRGFTER